MTQPHRARAAGFTLVELMVVVAIMGALASIAMPTLQRFTLRAKAAERTIVIQRIKKAIEDRYVQTGSSVPAAYGNFVLATNNPPWPPGAVKKAALDTLPEWNAYFPSPNPARGVVSIELGGSLHYSYSFWVWETPGFSVFTIIADGDLDGDGATSNKWIQYQRINGVYQTYDGWQNPPEGQEDMFAF